MASIYFIDEATLLKLTTAINHLHTYSADDLYAFGIEAAVKKLCEVQDELIANKIKEEHLSEHISSH